MLYTRLAAGVEIFLLPQTVFSVVMFRLGRIIVTSLAEIAQAQTFLIVPVIAFKSNE